MGVRLARLVPHSSAQPDSLEHVDPLSVRSLDRLFDGRLEAVREIQDDAGGLDAFDVARRELDVVRLGARGREVVDLERRAAGPLRREGEGIERRHDAVATSSRRRAAAGGQQGDQ